MKNQQTPVHKKCALGLSEVFLLQSFSNDAQCNDDSRLLKGEAADPKANQPIYWPTIVEPFSDIINQSESVIVKNIIATLQHTSLTQASVIDDIEQSAKALFLETKKLRTQRDFFADWMSEYSLDNREGLALLRLTECFLRVHNSPLAIHLVDEFIESADWQSHFYHSPSPWVNLSTLILDLGSQWRHKLEDKPIAPGFMRSVVDKLGPPCVIGIVKTLLKQLAKTFVCGSDIDDAVANCQAQQSQGFSQSFDMLGEEAITLAQADKFYESYHACIKSLATYQHTAFASSPGVSIKLSAIEPLYKQAHWPKVRQRLLWRLKTLVMLADSNQIPITLDAEESWRLEMQLDVMKTLLKELPLATPYNLGLAVQAYQPRALTCIDELKKFCDDTGKSIHIRLVKGAYWDTEIKYSQQQGHSNYSVFTNKLHTDLNYLACTAKIMTCQQAIYGQFATHNINTLASVVEIARRLNCTRFEFQKLHGMGDSIHQAAQNLFNQNTRIYCPVGKHDELLPYLVRRLLENGVNSSFLYHISQLNEHSELLHSPLKKLSDLAIEPKQLPAPVDLLLPKRPLAPSVFPDKFKGLDTLQRFLLQSFPVAKRTIGSIIGGIEHGSGCSVAKYSPINTDIFMGNTLIADDALVNNAINAAYEAFDEIAKSTVQQRTALLHTLATFLYEERDALTSLLVYEAGKSAADAGAEIKEAIDFCFYYAMQAKKLLTTPKKLDSICGETNELYYQARGIIACISPWNFPLAIFLGQVLAAFVTGNAVIAKPASATTLIATYVFELLCRAGIPKHWIQLVLTDSDIFSRNVLKNEAVAKVVFTGSLDAAHSINQTLATRTNSIAGLIAETGGLNFMVSDSSARMDQVISDALQSAFDSAGQRCSALRVLIVPTSQLDDYRAKLTEAMALLTVGATNDISNDIGPLISAEAKRKITTYIKENKNKVIYQTVVKGLSASAGHYVPPTLLQLNSLDDINQEVFGPVLHLAGYDEAAPENVVSLINKKRFGLTFGIHSRLPSRIELFTKGIRCGNIYVNRNIIGATVGMQPFGGCNLSGTGPKAGGGNYLQAFLTEKTVTINSTAIGGNPGLLNH
ncbi:MAG: bifunctional proline dehydrogenase/L-glutamate gamma-semialdehyde dehydrogenase PutA [Hahellaceae bacterium]|nr:bifunctional proline dehydrogenase/L-glutamate gamma-semialdehyde dehydrogenase PutA [Hahellaceae bacterium]